MEGLEGVLEARGMISEHSNTNREVRNIILDGSNTISEAIGDCLALIEGISGGFEAISEDPERIMRPVSAISGGYNAIRDVFEGY